MVLYVREGTKCFICGGRGDTKCLYVGGGLSVLYVGGNQVYYMWGGILSVLFVGGDTKCFICKGGD